MKLSKVVLAKDDRTAVLQGMIHVGPGKLYELLQSDIDWAVKNNYQIFYEGVKRTPLQRAATRNEVRIRLFLRSLLDLYPIWADVFGVSVQKEKISYPEDAINADLTFCELTRALDENGFSCDLQMKLLTMSPRDEVKAQLDKMFAQKSLNDIMDELDGSILQKAVEWLFMRKAMPIILDYRNEVALCAIQEQSDERNVFIHYGEKHIEGLLRLFQMDGWTVKETTHVDLGDFC